MLYNTKNIKQFFLSKVGLYTSIFYIHKHIPHRDNMSFCRESKLINVLPTVPDDQVVFVHTYLKEVFHMDLSIEFLDRISDYDYKIREKNGYPWFTGLESYSCEDLRIILRIGLFFVQPNTYFYAICSEILRRYCMSRTFYEEMKRIFQDEIDLEPQIKEIASYIFRKNLTNNYIKRVKKIQFNGCDLFLWENNIVRLCLFLDSSISTKTAYNTYGGIYCCLELGNLEPLNTVNTGDITLNMMYYHAFQGGFTCSLEWVKKRGSPSYIHDARNVETLQWSFENGLQIDSFLLAKIIEKKRITILEWILDNSTITDALFQNILDTAVWCSNIHILELLFLKGYKWTISQMICGSAIHTEIIEWHLHKFPWGTPNCCTILTKIQSELLRRAGCLWNIQYYTEYYDKIMP